ncbi:G patch domain and ankyrin repeat-containing protein 1 [Macrotis lagotis]|uniref:G patch domain and ankyrin repeat-containing protein 1 n=1 Tax=Macrotis lagotis TaxID=92651 RepID=UPI003D690CE5
MTLPAPIAFVPARDSKELGKDGCRPAELEPPLDGAAARGFYEALVGVEGGFPTETPGLPGAPPKGRRWTRRAGAPAAGRPSEGPWDARTARLLRAAQAGDVRQLRALLEPAGPGRGDVNARDLFWWTPLMCAARAGRGPAVRYLLARGAAWVGVCEPGGRDAAQLAEEAGFPAMARLIRESGGERRPEARPCSPLPKYCETCNSHYRDPNHNSSTAHLLSLSPGPQPPPFPPGVSTSSPGFQLLVKGGWEPGLGLGPGGRGRTAPIPTILKRDQEGLGYRPAPQPRITHFPAGDLRAVTERKGAPRAASLDKREKRLQEVKSQIWEQNLRTYMNLDSDHDYKNFLEICD